jgi:hypothetical protein
VSGVPIILDTDLSFDCDDAGALSMLHSLANMGEAQILGVMTSDIDVNSPATADAINTELGRPDIPIGMRAGASTDFGNSRYTGYVPNEFTHDTTAPADAVTLYTQILQAAAPNSVVIVTVGFLANVGQLLAAEPDLVAAKVKLLVSMAGAFPSGSEFNIYQSATSDAIYALHNWPTPVVYSGYEIGLPISTGSADSDRASVKRSYETCGLGNPRPSWDQTAVLYAVRGEVGRWTLSDPGQIVIAGNGANTWNAGGGDQRYLIKSAENDVIRSEIAGLM